MMRRVASLVCGLLLAGFVAGAAGEPLPVAVSVAPQAELVDRVGGDLVAVQVAVPAGASPHGFELTPRQVAELSRVRLYVATGVEVELPLLPRLRALRPDLMVIGPAAGAEPPDHAHDDPHRWLDPRLAAEQVREIAAALCRLDPDHADVYEARAAAELVVLDDLYDDLAAILAPVRGRDMVVAHPAFGHLAEAFGLVQVAVEQDGHQPTPRQLELVLERVRRRGSHALFVQPQFPRAAAERLAAAAGVELVVLDPLAGNYAENLRDMAVTIARVLMDPAAGP
ncbi:MAG: zinc ABC transporter substrate-binding protein [Candidatus Krumholzibacteriia bacterium]